MSQIDLDIEVFSKYFKIDYDLLDDKKYAIVQSRVSKHWSVYLIYTIQVLITVCIIAYLIKAIYIWNKAERKAKNFVIFIFVASIVYTLMLTIGVFLPVFSLPLFTALFHIGNLLLVGIWWAKIKVCFLEDEQDAEKVFRNQNRI